MTASLCFALALGVIEPTLDEETNPPVATSMRSDLRLELGYRLLDFERRLVAHHPEEPVLDALDASFDRATLAFFGGRSDLALAELDALIERLPPIDSESRACRETWLGLDDERLAAERDALATRLSRAIAKTPDLVDVAGIAFARLEKWRGDDAADTFRLVEPFDRFREDVAAEVATICRGIDPYRGKSGNHWQAISRRPIWSTEDVPNNLIPYRIVIPTQPKPDERFPVVIAFHGAGGDENMFPFAYGAGELARLAEERRFVLVAPLTYPFLWHLELFSKLLTRAEYLAPIDATRVYTLGHSLGCGPASAIAAKNRDSVAACVLFAGGETVAKSAPPTLLIVGDRDPLMPGRPRSQQARSPGDGSLEVRVIENRGHTLLVGEHLREAIDFLFSHALPHPETETPR